MSATFEDYGLTVTDVQSLMSTAVHPVILLIFGHGIHTCIFCAAVHYIAQSTRSMLKRITLASLLTFLWFANTIIVASEWKFVDDLFISHGVSLEDKFSFYVYGGTPDLVALNVFRALNTILADVILIWRCWVLYGGNLLVVTVPSVCLVTETISVCILVAVYSIRTIDVSKIHWILIYYSMTLMTNTVCTFLILCRIVRVNGIGASLKTYRGIIEILVESAAMYAIIYMALLIAYAYEFYTRAMVTTVSCYLTVISYNITGIAPTLIITRVMAGHSRPDDSWTRTSLPHLRTPMCSIAEPLQFASAPHQSHGTGHPTDVEQARESEAAEGEQDRDRDVRQVDLDQDIGREALRWACSEPGS